MPSWSMPRREEVAKLETRRLAAARLFARGESQGAVARALGVTPMSTSRWYRAWQAEGRRGLKAAGRLGRRPRLDRAQLARIDTALRQGAPAAGFPTDVWSVPRVAQLITRLTRERFHPSHVWRLLRALGWSVQRPARQARERDEAAIQRWRRRRWPQVKKRPPPARLARLRGRERPLATACRPPHLGAAGAPPNPPAHAE